MADNRDRLKSPMLISRTGSLFKTNYQTELFSALESRNKDKFKRLLNLDDIDVNYVYDEASSKTCLDYVCSEIGMSEYIDLILAKEDADINQINTFHKRTPLHFAAENANIDAVDKLINHPKIDADILCSGNTALHLAIKSMKKSDREKRQRYEEIIKLLIPKTNLNLPDSKHLTAIHTAANFGLESVIKSILDSEQYVDLEFDKDPITKKTARQVLEKSFPHLLEDNEFEMPEINHSTIDKFTKLYSHLTGGKEDLFNKDIDNITDEDVINKTSEQFTLLQLACKKGYDTSVKKLLLKGANPNTVTRSEVIKPIVYSCRNGYYKIIDLLINKTDINALEKESLLHTLIKYWKKETDESDVRINYKKCFDLLINNEDIISDINGRDWNGNSALHYAIKNGDDEIVSKLLENGAYLGVKNNYDEPPLLDISYKTLKSFLDSCLQTNHNQPNKPDFEYQFNYNFLKPPTNKKSDMNSCEAPLNANNNILTSESDILLCISKQPELKCLLKHPVITSFLYLKWQRISFLFYVNIVFYILFWLSLICFIILGAESQIDSKPTTTVQVLKIITFVGTILLTIREVVQIIVTPKQYWKNFENILEVVLIFVCYLLFFNSYFKKQQLDAIAILLSSAELLLLIGQFPAFSTNVEMLKTVSVNFFKFLLWYCILIIAFALSFYSLFREPVDKSSEEYVASKPYNPNKPLSDDDGETNFFLDPGMSLFKTIVMLTGEFDASSINFELFPVTSHVIFIIFVFMIPIVLFNLLNGLAVSDTQAIRAEAELVGVISRIQLMAYLESIFLNNKATTQNNKTNSSTDNQCCWLPNCSVQKLFCIRPIAERFCLFPNILPEGKISIKVNDRLIIKIINSDVKSKGDGVAVDICCFNCNCSDWIMEKGIVKSAKAILAKKHEDCEIETRLSNIENMLKEILDKNKAK